MTALNDADAVRVGASSADKVYLGSDVIWSGGGLTYSTEVLADAPLAYYRLGEASGTTMSDSSGNGRHGTYSGTAGLGAPGLIVSSTGDTAAALNAAGYGVVTNASWQDVTTASLEAWFKTTNTGANYICGRWDSGSNAQIFVDLQASDVVRCYAYVGGSTRIASVTVTGLRDGNPHHIVGTFGGTTVRLYVDGVEVATLAASGSLSTTAARSFLVGARSDSTTSNRFNGTLDEVAFYQGALSAARVAAHYAAGT